MQPSRHKTLSDFEASRINILSSHENFFEEQSTSSSAALATTGKPKDVNIRSSRRLVNELVNRLLEERAGTVEISSSKCSSIQFKPSEHSFDKRLKYWKDMLAERKLLGEKIKVKTGKKRGDILYNRQTTFDERDKQTVKRLLDYAERLDPLKLQTRKRLVMHERVDSETCKCIPALEETVPKAEKDGEKIVEISGMPKTLKVEQLGPCHEQGNERSTHWLRSKWLEEHIMNNREGLERVVEFYPDIENLEIIGESIIKKNLIKRDVDIKFLYEDRIKSISDTSSCDIVHVKDEKVVEELPEYGIKINDQVYVCTRKSSAQNIQSDINFECEPFETMTKRVLHLENIGRKVIDFEWMSRHFFSKNLNLLKATDDEFLFNRRPFRLLPGQQRDIIIQYQPRTVNIVKEKWVLRMDPHFFCRRADTIVLRLQGKCEPSSMYVNKLMEETRKVLEKSNIKMMEKLTKNMASLTPLIKASDVMCPYRRSLDEREIFEFNNPGYKCERFHDLELLKDIYARVKKPREHPWDLQLTNLRSLVLRVPNAEERALIYSEMIGILEEMKGKPLDIETKVENCPERDRTRLLYVRGIICTCIDGWEEITLSLEEAFFRPALREYYDNLEQEEEGDVKNPSMAEEAEVSEIVLKTIRHRKAFRDSLFIQTYTHLCDFIEDIVSVIESTEMV